MIAFPEEFERISIATVDEGLVEFVNREYRDISDEQRKTIKIKNGKVAQVLLELRKEDIFNVIAKYDKKTKYAVLEVKDCDAKKIDWEAQPEIMDYLNKHLTD